MTAAVPVLLGVPGHGDRLARLHGGRTDGEALTTRSGYGRSCEANVADAVLFVSGVVPAKPSTTSLLESVVIETVSVPAPSGAVGQGEGDGACDRRAGADRRGPGGVVGHGGVEQRSGRRW